MSYNPNMNVGILSLSSQLYSTKRLAEELQKLKQNVIILNPQMHTFETPMDYEKLPKIDILIPRVGMTQIKNSFKIIEYYQQQKTLLLNDYEDIKLCKNKWLQYQKLISCGYRLPHTVFVNKKKFQQKLIPYPFVLKILHGSQGYGVHKITNQQELDIAISKTPEEDFLFQEFLPEIYQGEYRVLLVGKKIITKIKKKPAQNEFKTNAHQNSQFELCTLNPAEEQELLKISAQFKLNLMSIDYVFIDNKITIIEINQSPGFEALEKATKLNIASIIAQHTLQLSSPVA